MSALLKRAALLGAFAFVVGCGPAASAPPPVAAALGPEAARATPQTAPAPLAAAPSLSSGSTGGSRSARIYTRADLEALEKQGSLAELLEHIEDPPPAERDDGWRALVTRAATGALRGSSPDAPETRARFADQLVRRHAFLGKSAEFRGAAADMGIAASASCARDRRADEECQWLVDFMRLLGEPRKAFEAGKRATQNGLHGFAVALYGLAAETEPRMVCAETSVLAEAISGEGQGPDTRAHKDSVSLLATCRRAK